MPCSSAGSPAPLCCFLRAICLALITTQGWAPRDGSGRWSCCCWRRSGLYQLNRDSAIIFVPCGDHNVQFVLARHTRRQWAHQKQSKPRWPFFLHRRRRRDLIYEAWHPLIVSLLYKYIAISNSNVRTYVRLAVRKMYCGTTVKTTVPLSSLLFHVLASAQSDPVGNAGALYTCVQRGERQRLITIGRPRRCPR